MNCPYAMCKLFEQQTNNEKCYDISNFNHPAKLASLVAGQVGFT